MQLIVRTVTRRTTNTEGFFSTISRIQDSYVQASFSRVFQTIGLDLLVLVMKVVNILVLLHCVVPPAPSSHMVDGVSGSMIQIVTC